MIPWEAVRQRRFLKALLLLTPPHTPLRLHLAEGLGERVLGVCSGRGEAPEDHVALLPKGGEAPGAEPLYPPHLPARGAGGVGGARAQVSSTDR